VIEELSEVTVVLISLRKQLRVLTNILLHHLVEILKSESFLLSEIYSDERHSEVQEVVI
jgi:hypothetical protein